MKALEKRAIVFTAICHALDHIFELTYGVVLIGIAEEFGAGLFILGVLANVAGFAFGLAAIPSGFLTDRIGERRLLLFFCLGSGIASIVVGLSPNIYVLGVALAVLGLALGIFHPDWYRGQLSSPKPPRTEASPSATLGWVVTWE